MIETEDVGLTVLVVEAEGPARTELLDLLGRDSRVGKVFSVAYARDALLLLQSHRVDGVFLDFELSGLSGVELAGVLARFRDAPPVVFVAHAADRVDPVAETGAVDHLLKPVGAGPLAEAVARLAAVAAQTRPSPTTADDEAIPVELAGSTRLVALRDVQYVEAHGDYARLHTDSATHLVRVPMSTLQQRWAAAGFVRIHRSYLVSLNHVTDARLGSEQGVVVLGTAELAVSRRHLRDVRAVLAERIPSDSPTLWRGSADTHAQGFAPPP